jgi:hypothetical protein
MRKSLRWAFAATLVVTAASFWPREPQRTVAAAEPRMTAAAAPAVPDTSAALPSTLDSWAIEPARRDAFAPVEPPGASPPPLPPAPEAHPPAPPPTPTAPSVTYRYLGRMTTPEGMQITLLARGDVTLPVAAGTPLDEGYVVESVGRDAVRLVYPPLGTTVDIPIPPAERSSSR